MWPDNETDIDLLGFDFVVDSLVIVLSQPRLLPLTVGVLGDWGSGKSSLMKQACAELIASTDGDVKDETTVDTDGTSRRKYVCVQFSPWRYEDYEDVKVALMTTVLSHLAAAVPQRSDEVRGLRALGRKLGRFGRRTTRGGLGLVPATVPVVVGILDPTMDPEAVKVMQQATQMATSAVAQRLADQPAAANVPADEPVTEVDAFRDRFAALIESLEEVEAVVVFIDDLDRCLPETVVDTFEAIRLLLGAPHTAFVLAAHQQVVESAVDARYPGLRGDDRAGGIGARYLEKMFQQKITVPALAIPEAVTYVNLLLAELHLSADDFRVVREHVATQRAVHTLEVTFDLGTLGELGIDVPAELVTDLRWSAAIAPVLASGSRRNPRQLKQFLNTLQLRRLSAARRKVTLKPDVLAKLMLLEDQQFKQFQQLFDWQIAHGASSCPELAAAEQLALSPESAPAQDPSIDDGDGNSGAEPRKRAARRTAAPKVGEAVKQWSEDNAVNAWLHLPPRLASEDLRPYFTYSRDRLSLNTVSISRLSLRQRQLLGQLLGPTDKLRRAALDELSTMDQADRDAVFEAVAGAVVVTPDDAFVAACETIDRFPDARDRLFGALGRLPISAVPAQHVPTAAARLPVSDARTDALLTKWHQGSRPDLTQMVTLARRSRAKL